MDQQTVIFLGPQGSGKGTQVQLFKKFLQDSDPARTIVHMEMGAALRQFSSVENAGYTQDMVRAAMSLYTTAPNGLPGGDDLGTMSGWYVLSALGLYPVMGGDDLVVDQLRGEVTVEYDHAPACDHRPAVQH